MKFCWFKLYPQRIFRLPNSIIYQVFFIAKVFIWCITKSIIDSCSQTKRRVIQRLDCNYFKNKIIQYKIQKFMHEYKKEKKNIYKGVFPRNIYSYYKICKLNSHLTIVKEINVEILEIFENKTNNENKCTLIGNMQSLRAKFHSCLWRTKTWNIRVKQKF